MMDKEQNQNIPQSLREASGLLAEKLNRVLTIRRPNRRGRKSDLAGDLYVRGVAESLGITVTHMSRILTGRSRPGMALASRIADFAHCTIEDILAVSSARAREQIHSPTD